MELKQTQQQQMKMAPMLFEAISLLQYNQMDLNAYLKEKALENPLIEFRDAERPPVRVSSGSMLSTTDIIENTLSNSFSFRDELKDQARFHPSRNGDEAILMDMIDNLDEKGYWLEDLEEWADTMAYPFEAVEAAFEVLRSLEPAGVGATNLQDCLLLQVERLNIEHKKLICDLIRNYLELLAQGDWEMLSIELRASKETLHEAYEMIRGLSPYPVKGLDQGPVNYIVPDLTLEQDGGRFFLKLDKGALPKLSLNQSYYSNLLSIVNDKKDRSYIQKKFTEADWLIKGLHRREETMVKIAEALTNFHEDQLGSSPENWTPLTLKEVADEVGIHESTVSRAIRDKYVRTPYGLMELKHFFPKGIKQGLEKGVSTAQIKEWLRELIQHEDPNHPFSDQDLVGVLSEKNGVNVSRRAVAKYRTEMHIGSSMKRKKRT